MKEVPSHRMRLYVEAKAMPLRAPDAMSGSPSPWKVLVSTPKQTNERIARVDASPRLNDVFMVVSLFRKICSSRGMYWLSNECKSQVDKRRIHVAKKYFHAHNVV